MNNINKKMLILVISILLLIAIFRFSENNADFSTYNPNWNGGMQIRNLISENHTVISLPNREDISLFQPDKSAFVILGPRENFSEKDIESVKKFVNAGGLFIIADDFGTGNQLLDKLSASVSFSSLLLHDDINFWKNSTFPVVITDIENASNITMNYGTSLIIRDNSTNILANSSRFSWLSRNESEGGKRSYYPVMAEITSGRGEIVVISDPSIFINSMLPMQDNKLLLGKLVGKRIYVNFDETERTPPVIAFNYIIKNNTTVQYLFAVIILSLTLIYIKRDQISTFRMKKIGAVSDMSRLDEENIVSDILKRHNWDKHKFTLFRNKIRGK